MGACCDVGPSGSQEANREPVAGQQVRRDLAVLVSAPRHVVALQDQHGGGSNSDRQHDEPGILPALAVPHETRLRVRQPRGSNGPRSSPSRTRSSFPRRPADSVKSA